jgi:broad specificity phosphatase PhoE
MRSAGLDRLNDGRVWPRVFLIRHADASQGVKDPDLGRHLSPLGVRQAQAHAARVGRWQLDAIVCSDMHRCYETAAALRTYHPQVPLIVDATFREVSAGTVARATEASKLACDELNARLERAWQQVVTMPYGVAVIVTHNGLIKYLIGRAINAGEALKPRFRSALAGITAIEAKSKGRASLRFFNDTRHLTPDLLVPGRKMAWMEDPETGRWLFEPEAVPRCGTTTQRETALDETA